MISRRAKALKPSPTLAMANRARELQAQGKDVISLTVGEPDWATFSVANAAGIEAIEKGFTKYTAAHGIPELRQEVAKQTSEQLSLAYTANDVVIGAGAKYVLFSILMMLLDEGEEVLVPAPYWVSYPTMVELAGGIPRFIACDETVNFKLTPALLAAHITPKTKALILCSPSNPTGLQYSREELQGLAEVLRKNPHVCLISDDIYNRLLFSADQKMSPHILHVAPDLKERVLVVNGASKTYSMTGWRVGWALGPSEVIKPLADFLSQTTSSLCSISQKAALAALQKGEPELVVARKNLLAKCLKIEKSITGVRGLKVTPPDGAFYLWVDIRECFGRTHKKSGRKIQNSNEVAEILLNDHWVATVPGIEFGSEGYLRLSFVTSESNLEKAAQRLKDFSAEIFT
jgi:aspartate aminotransferase